MALPRPPTNLRVESAQHNMIKVDYENDQYDHNLSRILSQYDHNMIKVDYDDDDDYHHHHHFQVKWDSPTQDSIAIDRSRYKVSHHL